MEEWRPIEGWPYEVSSLGRVRNRRGAIMALTPHNHGYLQAWLANKGLRRKEYVHRLVAFAFCGAPPAVDSHADHIDGNRANNEAANIRWLSPRDNRALRRFENGERHHAAKLSDETVRQIRADRSLNNRQIARALGVSRETVRDIRLGKERTHDVC